MVVCDGVLTSRGVLLVGRGTVVTESLILRLENFIRQGKVTGPSRVEG